MPRIPNTERIKVRRVEGHKCVLPIEDELITLYINGGILVKWRRKFRQFCMVSASSPETKSILKSTAQIRTEENRHLNKYYYMIHPFSAARMIWETFMLFVYGFLYILMPIELGTPITYSYILYTKFCFDVFSFVDIILFFFTGYFEVKKHKVIMEPLKVFKKYLFSYFIFDLISSFPYNMCVTKSCNEHVSCLEQWVHIKHLYIFKLIRVPTFNKYLQKFLVRMELWNYMMKSVSFITWILILIWWATAYWYLIEAYINSHSVEYFKGQINTFNPTVEGCLQVIRAYMLMELGREDYDNTILLTFSSVCLAIGCFMNIIIFAQVVQVYKKDSNSRNKYENLMQEINEFMKYKELPSTLKHKVFRYVEFKFQKNIYNEEQLMKTLSKIIRQEILLHTCKKLVQKVNFFQGLPIDLIVRIVKKLRTEVYLPNDLIVQAGVAGNAMYFVYMGTVAVYTITGEEMCHLEDGTFFGEISLIINEPRVASVVAATECEVLKLSRRDFLEAVEPYPELYKKIRESALERLKTVEQMANHELHE